MDLIIEARAFVDGRLQDMEIGIDEQAGTIVEVRRDLPGKPRKRYRGKILLPSAVDWHVHFREPGATRKEDFRTGTIGAACGGVGTVLDMPNTTPLVDRVSRLEEKEDVVRPKACVDWGLWATVSDRTTDPVTLASKAVGLKVYLAPTTGIAAPPTEALVSSALHAARSANRWTSVHAEGVPLPGKERTTRDHDQSRPVEAEARAIEALGTLAAGGQGISVAHATSVEAVEAATAAGFTASATPHHLLLSYESHKDAWAKVNPPLRSPATRDRLWGALQEGKIHRLESDHAPHTLDEKRRAFAEAPAGIPGVETLVPLLLAQVKRGGLELAALVGASSERPAADMGLKKGRIAPGYEADFFLADTHDVQEIRVDRLHGKAGWTPFEGLEAIFPSTHYLRGDVVVEEGEFIGRAGRGRKVRVDPVFPTVEGTARPLPGARG